MELGTDSIGGFAFVTCKGLKLPGVRHDESYIIVQTLSPPVPSEAIGWVKTSKFLGRTVDGQPHGFILEDKELVQRLGLPKSKARLVLLSNSGRSGLKGLLEKLPQFKNQPPAIAVLRPLTATLAPPAPPQPPKQLMSTLANGLLPHGLAGTSASPALSPVFPAGSVSQPLHTVGAALVQCLTWFHDACAFLILFTLQEGMSTRCTGGIHADLAAFAASCPTNSTHLDWKVANMRDLALCMVVGALRDEQLGLVALFTTHTTEPLVPWLGIAVDVAASDTFGTACAAAGGGSGSGPTSASESIVTVSLLWYKSIVRMPSRPILHHASAALCGATC